MTETESHISNLALVLSKYHPDLEWLDIAEALWLAQFMDFVPSTNTSDIDTSEISPTQPDITNTEKKPHVPEKPESPEAPEEQTDTAKTEVENESDNIPLYSESPSDSPTLGGSGGQPIRAPGVRMLQNRLLLERSLRPLNHHILSKQYLELDEDRTVEASAEQNIIIPVLKGKAERWLEVHLVLDSSLSMTVWRETQQELVQLFKNSGIYSDVRVWYLFADEQEKPYLTASSDSESRQCDQKELLNPRKQQLTLICTDCVSAAWLSGFVIAKYLDPWKEQMPVAILQMLPQRLWTGTALRNAVAVNFTSTCAAALNKQLMNDDWFEADEGVTPSQFPVITIDPRSLNALAKVIKGSQGNWVSGVLVEDGNFPVKTKVNKLTAEQRIQRFLQQASPQALKLAEYLSCTPLMLPVMRMIQHVMLPTSNQGHLAEFLLGGLVRVIKTNSNNSHYEFHPQVHELLLNRLGVYDREVIFLKATEYFTKNIGSVVDFKAVLRGEGFYHQQLSNEGKEFLRLAIELAQKIVPDFIRKKQPLQPIADKPQKKHTHRPIDNDVSDVVFISFSKKLTGEVASIIETTLNAIYPGKQVKAYLSNSPISLSGYYEQQIDDAMVNTKFAISILSSEEKSNSSQMMYEAGALSLSTRQNGGLFLPYLFCRHIREVEAPLQRFQAKQYQRFHSTNYDQFKEIFIEINKTLSSGNQKDENDIEDIIYRRWDGTEKKLDAIALKIENSSQISEGADMSTASNENGAMELSEIASNSLTNEQEIIRLTDDFSPTTPLEIEDHFERMLKTFRIPKHWQKQNATDINYNATRVIVNNTRFSTYVVFTDGKRIMLFNRAVDSSVRSYLTQRYDAFGSVQFENRTIKAKITNKIFLNSKIQKIEGINGIAIEDNRRGHEAETAVKLGLCIYLEPEALEVATSPPNGVIVLLNIDEIRAINHKDLTPSAFLSVTHFLNKGLIYGN